MADIEGSRPTRTHGFAVTPEVWHAVSQDDDEEDEEDEDDEEGDEE